MSVPRFYDFMPPIIQCLGENATSTLREISAYCANVLNLSESDRAETIESGQNRLLNRVSWANSYLKKAGLVYAVHRGRFSLTDEGKKAYNKGSECVTIDYLKQYASFNEFRGQDADANEKQQFDPQNDEKSESPLEQIESALEQLNNELADDLMQEIMKITAYEFESLVVKLLIGMGYGKMEENADAVTKQSGDEGIDGIVSADKFGFDSIYIQAKQWKTDSVVGRPEIQKFLGALAGKALQKEYLSLPQNSQRKRWILPPNNFTARLFL